MTADGTAYHVRVPVWFGFPLFNISFNISFCSYHTVSPYRLRRGGFLWLQGVGILWRGALFSIRWLFQRCCLTATKAYNNNNNTRPHSHTRSPFDVWLETFGTSGRVRHSLDGSGPPSKARF